MTDERDFLLLAEDNPADVWLIRLAMKAHAVPSRTQVVADGEAAVQFIDRVENDPASLCPSLAIVDLNLPRIGGDEILRRIRSSKRWRDVPVIVVSSSISMRDRKDALDLGASAYFSKPSDLEEFLKLGGVISDILTTRCRL